MISDKFLDGAMYGFVVVLMAAMNLHVGAIFYFSFLLMLGFTAGGVGTYLYRVWGMTSMCLFMILLFKGHEIWVFLSLSFPW